MHLESDIVRTLIQPTFSVLRELIPSEYQNNCEPADAEASTN